LLSPEAQWLFKMKNSLFLLALFLSLPLLISAQFPGQIVVLNSEPLPDDLLPLVKEKVSGRLFRFPPSGLKGEPVYRTSSPFYGVILLAGSPENRFLFVLDGDLLYIDSDADGNLRAERPLLARPREGGLYRKTLLSFSSASLRMNYPGAAFEDYFVKITCDLETETFYLENVGYRTGMVTFPVGKDFRIAIYDSTPPNGKFDDYQQDIMLIDLNRDGKFDITKESSELLLLAKTVNLFGTLYALEVPPSGEYLSILQFSEGAATPSGKATVRYQVEYNNKVKIEKETKEVLFGADNRFRMLFLRGPVAFRRGARVEVKVEEGILILSDSQNLMWQAEFFGYSPEPVLTTDRFPTEVSLAFPFKMDLFSEKEEYQAGKEIELVMRLQGQAKEIYVRFLVEEAPNLFGRSTGSDWKQKIMKETLPHIIISDKEGKVVVEGDMSLESTPANQEAGYRFRWQAPLKGAIPSGREVYTATVTWDTGPFQGVVSGQTTVSVFVP